MVESKEIIFETLKNIKNELNVNYRVKKIGLFGSYVRKKQTATSDIDFLVEFEKDADLFRSIFLVIFFCKYPVNPPFGKNLE